MRSGSIPFFSALLVLAVPSLAAAQSSPSATGPAQPPESTAPRQEHSERPIQAAALSQAPYVLTPRGPAIIPTTALHANASQAQVRIQQLPTNQSCAHILIYQAHVDPDDPSLIPIPNGFASNMPLIRPMPPCPNDYVFSAPQRHLYLNPHPFLPRPPAHLKPLSPPPA